MAAMDVDPSSECKVLFAQVQFYVVLNHDFGVDQAEAVSLRRVPRISDANPPHIACEIAQRQWRAGSTTSVFGREDTYGRCHSCHFHDH